MIAVSSVCTSPPAVGDGAVYKVLCKRMKTPSSCDHRPLLPPASACAVHYREDSQASRLRHSIGENTAHCSASAQLQQVAAFLKERGARRETTWSPQCTLMEAVKSTSFMIYEALHLGACCTFCYSQCGEFSETDRRLAANYVLIILIK